MSNHTDGETLDDVSFLIITANVGTLFEDLSGLEDAWIQEFIKLIESRSPHFIALHFQEVGGKDYKSSMSHVDAFIEKILALHVLEDFDTVRGYLDEDFDSVEQYTALGNFYFVHKSLDGTSIWNYDKKEFSPAHGIEVYDKDLEKRWDFIKEKFEQGYFPDCKWSRKGYSRVRWKIKNKVFEFVNIHLFHDDNNLVAIQSSPSSYSRSRKRALKFVLQRVQSDPPPNGNYFIFGDFNFRLDIKALVQKLCASSKQQVIRSQDNDDILRLLYRAPVSGDDDSDANNDHLLLMIEKKVFQYDQKLLHKNGNYEHLRRFNGESEDLLTDLKEFSFNFAPTYPYSEKLSEGNEYMKTRCPAWCDRVFLSPHAWNWVNNEGTNINYDTIGKQVCMGDHKPIFLAFNLNKEAFAKDEDFNGTTPALIEESSQKINSDSIHNNNNCSKTTSTD
ncbi:inositol polyphosphate-5-phosphatase A-like [Styela clava]